MGKKLLLLLLGIFLATLINAATISEEIHINIEVEDDAGTELVSETFDFTFNITTQSDCTGVSYTNITTLTTDEDGIISYYLTNITMNFTDQSYLCIYRSGDLTSNLSIARNPYAFTARNVSCLGITGATSDLCTITDTTIGNCSGDNTCANIIYNIEIDTFSELDSIVADANMCRLDAVQTFTSFQSFTGGLNSSDWTNVTVTESQISDLVHTTDTNASTACSGTTTYLDGEGNCDDVSLDYINVNGDIMTGSMNFTANWTMGGGLMYWNGTCLIQELPGGSGIELC